MFLLSKIVSVSAAKKMMSLVGGRGDADSAASSSSLSLRAKKNKRKLYRPEISSPMDMPSHPVSVHHTQTAGYQTQHVFRKHVTSEKFHLFYFTSLEKNRINPVENAGGGSFVCFHPERKMFVVLKIQYLSGKGIKHTVVSKHFKGCWSSIKSNPGWV